MPNIVESMENNGRVDAPAFTAQDSSTVTSSRILETRPASSNPSQGLPSIVVLEIFQYLDLRSLLKCRLVCSGCQYLVDSTASLQYKIELAVAGQQDGSYGDMFKRREMLKMHQKRWDELQWTEVLHVPMMLNHCWGFCGGVFAQHRAKPYTLHLKRIPSQSRGIKEKNWILDLSTLLGQGARMENFGMDPSQDLLAIVSSAGDDVRIHLLTLSKGERHPLTTELCIVPHDLGSLYHIDICYDFLSIYTERGAVLWNWKTGQVLMHIVDYNIASMEFLNERYILMAIMEDIPYLLVIDFLAEPPERRGLNELENYFIFRFPDIQVSRSSLVHDITVRSNPRSTWGAGTEPSVPFSMVPQDRLFVVHLSFGNDDENLYFAILEASFLSLIKTDLQNNSFDWSMWGPEGSRILPNHSYLPIWISPSHGTRFAMKRYLPHGGILVDVYDFNQLRCRNKKQDSDVEAHGNVNVSESSEIIEGRPVCVLGPTRIKTNIFHDEVDTRLGYSVTSRSIPGKTYAKSVPAMCSEDAVIIMDNVNKMYEIYTV